MNYLLKKCLLCLILVALLLVTITGCETSVDKAEADKSLQESVIEEAATVTKPTNELPEDIIEPYIPDNPADFTFYWITTWDEKNPILLPNSYPIEEAFTGKMLSEILMSRGYDSKYSSDKYEISMSGDTALLNLPKAVGDNIYSSIAETLLRNCSAIKKVKVLRENTTFPSKVLSNEGYYIADTDYSLPTYTSEELFQLQQSVPVQYLTFNRNLSEGYGVSPEQQVLLWVSKDTETKELTKYLEKIHWYNVPTKGFNSPSEIPPSFALRAAMNNIKAYSWSQEYEDSNIVYEPTFLPLGETSGFDTMLLQTHLEIAAKELLGENATITFEEIPSMCMYDPYVGVIKPDGEWYAYNTPVILDYTKAENIFTIEAVFIGSSFPDGELRDEENDLLTSETIAEYYDRLERYTITLEKRESGGYNYISFKLAEK